MPEAAESGQGKPQNRKKGRKALPREDWIRALRGPKNKVDPWRPSHFMTEQERTADGAVEDVNAIFLTNRECPFACLMCDLWKNTLDERVPPGAIPAQIGHALEVLPAARHLKLYNSASFFDPGAIPEEDYPAIAQLVSGYETVIIENHPRFTGERVLRFADMIGPKLEVGLGLECIHPDILPALNKRMQLEDFCRAVDLLNKNSILCRAFILLRPPFLSEEEGLDWACRSIDFAFDAGVDCCTVIPARAGNGAMDALQESGEFSPPALRSLEAALTYGIGLKRGRVFADTWDLEAFADCPVCYEARRDRITAMNHRQELLPPVSCNCHTP